MIHHHPPPATFFLDTRGVGGETAAKNGRARPGTSLIFHFVAYRYRGGAAARRGAGGGPPRGIVTPPPPPLHERAHKAGEKGGEGEKESVEKKGRQI